MRYHQGPASEARAAGMSMMRVVCGRTGSEINNQDTKGVQV
jgi:hypothetical protein